MLFIAQAAERINLKRVIVHRAVLKESWKIFSNYSTDNNSWIIQNLP